MKKNAPLIGFAVAAFVTLVAFGIYFVFLAKKMGLDIIPPESSGSLPPLAWEDGPPGCHY